MYLPLGLLILPLFSYFQSKDLASHSLRKTALSLLTLMTSFWVQLAAVWSW